jgi:hypothetical protein
VGAPVGGSYSLKTHQWSEVKDLPFLDACVNEAVRLHPPFCLLLERVVPEGDAVMCGRHFPEGTCTEMNPYVVNRHRPTFGEDADQWRPERWLVDDLALRKKLAGSITTVCFTFDEGANVLTNILLRIAKVRGIVRRGKAHLRWEIYCTAGDQEGCAGPSSQLRGQFISANIILMD